MININGSIQVVPTQVSVESGTLRVDENNTQPAVIQTLNTMVGPVQVIYPAQAIDSVIDGLKQAKEEADKKQPPTDLYIPSSMNEAEAVAKAQQAIVEEGNVNEIGKQQ